MAFHVTLNGLNRNAKNNGERWGTLDILILHHVSFKAVCVLK